MSQLCTRCSAAAPRTMWHARTHQHQWLLACSAWCSLESRLQEYHGLLLARSQGLGEVEALAQQNAELQALLDQYMASDVNKTLAIPPTQLVG
jgi:hypothetical protein